MAASIESLVAGKGVSPDYAGENLPLAFLTPGLVATILDGRQPPRLTLQALFDLPEDWPGHRARFAQFA